MAITLTVFESCSYENKLQEFTVKFLLAISVLCAFPSVGKQSIMNCMVEVINVDLIYLIYINAYM